MGFFSFLKNKTEAEVAYLARLLNVTEGSTVAEIGAGKGSRAMAMAWLVGHVYATEFDPGRLLDIKREAYKTRLKNITVLEGQQQGTGLPKESCDGIFMRVVYHHFTHPLEINRSLFETLKSKGRLLIIDFPPRRLLWFSRPKDVPKNRGGHGIPQAILISEVLGAGFELVQKIDNWATGLYCVIFRKP